ncbi:MAG: hypothetical protein E7660_01425 [Ruminococcaceae bacterium]|nr:hypothetical protein [Oscillospiraceae bacterium]
MLKLIIGGKGAGKTKQLIELVNSSLDTTNGDVVCIEKGNKLRFDIKYQCRLIEADEFEIENGESLYGFVAGILASNNDVKHLFIDSALKIIGNDEAEFDKMIAKLDKLVNAKAVECVITSSIEYDAASETVNKYIAK